MWGKAGRPEFARDHAGVADVVPLVDGDLAWVFGPDVDRAAVLPQLTRSAENVQRLAAAIGGQAGWKGSGLEFVRCPGGGGYPPQELLGGYAQNPDWASFEVEVMPVTGGWVVSAEISVRCDAPIDCGMHVIEQWDDRILAEPTAAAAELLAATEWLLARGTAERATYWREHDARSGHP